MNVCACGAHCSRWLLLVWLACVVRRPRSSNQELVIARRRNPCASQLALGLREGPVHAELRIHDDGPVVMEVAARTIGGECARLLSFGTGRSLEELVILHATGRPLRLAHMAGAAGVLMLPIPAGGILRRIEGTGAARAVPGIMDVLVTIRDGYELVPLPEGGSYLGFVFAQCLTPEETEAALRNAHAKLNIVIALALRIEDGRSV